MLKTDTGFIEYRDKTSKRSDSGFIEYRDKNLNISDTGFIENISDTKVIKSRDKTYLLTVGLSCWDILESTKFQLDVSAW